VHGCLVSRYRGDFSNDAAIKKVKTSQARKEEKEKFKQASYSVMLV
jgi:hypothetical protein